MTLPKIKVGFDDYQLGLVPEVADTHVKIGVAQAGPTTPQRLSRGLDVLTTYAGGPLAGAMAVALIETSPVMGLRVAATTPGSAAAPVKAGTGAGLMTTTGTPNDAYTIVATVTRSGTRAVGTAAVVISVAGQDGPERAVPVNGTLDVPGTGLSVVFDAGALVAGDTYTVTSAAPVASTAAIADALTTLLASRPDVRFIHILGAATPGLVAAVDAILMERQTRNVYRHAILEARPMNAGETMSDYLTAIDTQFAGVTSLRVALALDGGLMYNPLTRTMERRNSAWKATGRRARVPIGEAAYRVRTGALSAMGELTYDANVTGTSGRYVALRTLDGREGVYVADWPLLAPAGSDYNAVQRREVIDRAAEIGYTSALTYLGDDFAVDTLTGKVLETEALAFDDYIAGRIQAGLGDNVSGVRVHLDREENILSTEHLTFSVSVIPLGYARTITMTVGFANPFLAAQSPAASVAAAPAKAGA